jgi:hypothetical protein
MRYKLSLKAARQRGVQLRKLVFQMWISASSQVLVAWDGFKRVGDTGVGFIVMVGLHKYLRLFASKGLQRIP